MNIKNALMAQYNIIALRSSGHQHHCVRCIFGATIVIMDLVQQQSVTATLTVVKQHLCLYYFRVRLLN